MKRKYVHHQTQFARTPMCQSMVACDGTNLRAPERIAKGMCAKCEETLKKRQERAK